MSSLDDLMRQQAYSLLNQSSQMSLVLTSPRAFLEPNAVSKEIDFIKAYRDVSAASSISEKKPLRL